MIIQSNTFKPWIPFESALGFAIRLASQEYILYVEKKEISQETDAKLQPVTTEIFKLRDHGQLMSKDNHHAIRKDSTAYIWIRAIEMLEFAAYHPSTSLSFSYLDFHTLEQKIELVDDDCFIRTNFSNLLRGKGRYLQKDAAFSHDIIDVLMTFKIQPSSYRGFSEGLNIVLDIIDYVYNHPDQFPKAFIGKKNGEIDTIIHRVVKTLNLKLGTGEDINHIRFCLRPFKGRYTPFIENK
jgi:hypothetical protein